MLEMNQIVHFTFVDFVNFCLSDEPKVLIGGIFLSLGYGAGKNTNSR